MIVVLVMVVFVVLVVVMVALEVVECRPNHLGSVVLRGSDMYGRPREGGSKVPENMLYWWPREGGGQKFRRMCWIRSASTHSM